MARYELAGGFFWTIVMSDTTVTTTVGKLGNAGHTRMKNHGSPAEARRAYDAAIVEKLEQGYVQVDEGDDAPPAPSEPSTKRAVRKQASARTTKRPSSKK